MKRILMFVFLSMLTVTMVYGQGMSDTQVLQFIMKEKKARHKASEGRSNHRSDPTTSSEVQQTVGE